MYKLKNWEYLNKPGAKRTQDGESPSSVQAVQDASLPTGHSPLKLPPLSTKPHQKPREPLINSLWSWTCLPLNWKLNWTLFFSRLLSRQWGHRPGASTPQAAALGGRREPQSILQGHTSGSTALLPDELPWVSPTSPGPLGVKAFGR